VLGVPVTHPAKLLWPADGITKLDLARYYERIAPVILRYVAQRPITLRPFPHGTDRPGFYLKNAPKGAPPWLRTFTDVAESTGRPVHFVLAQDARSLVWVAQLNAVEIHPWLSRIDVPDRPDWAVVDLDPAGEIDAGRWQVLVRAARAVRDHLAEDGLRSFPKLSGQTGMHVLVPLLRAHPFAQVRSYFERLAQRLCAAFPDLLTMDYDIAGRGGRTLIDYAQNARAKTTVAPYSVRPRPGAPVAVPLTWDELDDSELRPSRWTIRTIFSRLDAVGDVLEPALQLRQRLPLRGARAA
jgi:bifunctional non-homologous end joining protein LigD